ncbi:endoplasmic reticulum metallopeptidase 1-like isoform X2 [Pimephales promelas]|uniref:endoplasmic reticulum metallopeptidase 1-like isoform X2 n=1 Tax=Pimephales promelas TaxID=90988 RepID=UPI001955C893|nr:endoplasmic reticulum metallopeptidase 1-like isoform X2 [Pimephales promelas]KAG1974105.1 endoplasmic reticulum metallopeptidase [Pimephales promelas]
MSNPDMQMSERDSTTVRRIRTQQNQTLQTQENQEPDDGDEEAALNGPRIREHTSTAVKKREFLRESCAVVLLLGFLSLMWVLVLVSVQQIIIRSRSTGHFNATRARMHLDRITSVGPRTVGSPEIEVTVNYLQDQIEQIRSESKAGSHSITVDVQRPSGTFSIGFLICYDHLTNIAVRLEPKTGAQHFMLANCHFDTVADSPGASDDAVSCSVMLEILRSLANLSTPLKHGVIFLFNGAEENMLTGSHGFITKHPWAQQVRAFVNLDAAGVGGKELVFQTGPENPWLVQAYVQAAVHPFASVVGQEVFQSGFIPSDTDFRIFRDFGNIPGIDLAFIENGYLYHTKYDTPERIHIDSIQRAGDNILSVLKHLVMSDELADSSEHRHGNMVFFDLLGLTMVAYPAHVGTIINYVFAVATVIYLGWKCMLNSSVGCRCTRDLARVCIAVGCRYTRDLVCAVVMVVLSWVMALLTVLLVAWLVTLMGRSMFWYTHFYAAVSLYGSAAASMILLIHTLAKSLYYRCVQSASRVDLAELFFDVSLLLWCCLLLFLTVCGLCSAYVPMMMVVFPLVSKLLLRMFIRAKGASLLYTVLYLMGLAVPYVHIMFLTWVVFEIFTPIQGRSGTREIRPDFFMASIVTLATVILSTYFMHFIYLWRSTKCMLAVLGSVFTLMFVLVCSGLFFPYSGDPSSPRPKRVSVQHITRRSYALNGSLQSSDSGFWINSLDYTGMQHITPHIPEINDSIHTHCQDFYCPFPWLSITENWYLPAPEAFPDAPLEFQLLSRQDTEWGTVNMTFEVKGPSHMSLLVLPSADVFLRSRAFGDGKLYYYPSEEDYIFYSHGLDAPAWNFWFEIQSLDASPDEGLISLAITAHYFSGSDRRSEQLESFLKRFPPWVFPSSWISTYHVYRF